MKDPREYTYLYKVEEDETIYKIRIEPRNWREIEKEKNTNPIR